MNAHLCALALFSFSLAAAAQLPRETPHSELRKQASKVTPSRKASVVSAACAELLAEVTHENGPGAVFLVAQGQRVLYQAARGNANIELKVPLAQANVFRIASVTKMFTAAMILKLSEGHRLSVDDPLSAYLPDFPNGRTFTIRQLLSHTAGISETATGTHPNRPNGDTDTATQLADIRMRPLDFEPGTHWAYSNAGFIVLGAVIEKVTGKPWYQAISDDLLTPLGLTHTHHAENLPIVSGRAAGYSTDTPNHIVQNATYISMTVPAAAGALESTADDLRLWMHDLVSGRVLSKEDLKRMTTPGPELPGSHPGSAYGLGMYVWQVRGRAVLGHTGQVNGFTSFVGYVPKDDVTVVVLANDDNFDAQTVGRRVTAIALGSPYTTVVRVEPSDEELRALAGVYRSDETTLETLSVKDRQLYAQRGKRNVIPLQMTANGELHFVPDELSYFRPVRDANGAVTRLDYFQGGEGPARPLPRQ